MTTPPQPAGPVGDDLIYDIVFDGGSLGNPGRGYGSFAVTRDGEMYHPADRADYPGRLTNNQAEYMTLIRALEWLRDDLGEARYQTTVTVHGDSQLVVNQLNGTWKIRNENMRDLASRAMALLTEFRQVTISWHARENSVRVLGH